MELRQVRRRDGTLAPFERERIVQAGFRALRETGTPDRALAEAVAARAIDELASRPGAGAVEVEEIQDAIERALAALGRDDAARAFVLYRSRRAELRDAKRLLGVRDELKLGLGAVTVLAERYLRRDDRGRVVESTREMLERVARHVAAAEDELAGGSSAEAGERFLGLLGRLEFLPNSPTLMNAGTSLGMLAGCVVLPIEDSLESIFAGIGQAALVHQAGGGTGFSFSRLRPAGDRVASTGGVASGPVSFMRIFDTATDVMRLGGRRRGANMAVLDVSHPDVEAFVTAKEAPGTLENFNLSVALTDRFMRAALARGTHRLVNPRTGRATGRRPAAELLRRIAEAAWRSGDPGALFIDRVNRANPTPTLGRIESTNPCGEVPLLPYESCVLGSLNLSRFVAGESVDWQSLAEATRLAVRFLDDVVGASRFPFPELEEAALRTRKIGLGVMGLAELLALLGIPYDSEQAVRLAGRIARHVRKEARLASARLAAERGPFPVFPESVYARRGSPPLRNAQLTSIAPTGTISMVAGTTSGIEPMFALAYVRNVLGRRLLETNALFEQVARARGFYSEALVAEIAATGGVAHVRGVPSDVRRAFVTALEIDPAWHLRMQAAVQRHVDAAVSKTVNLPEDVGVREVERILVDAWRAGAKGVTVYRYGSRAEQVLSLPEGEPVQTVADYAGGCAGRSCEY